jgi:hypothetical protein
VIEIAPDRLLPLATLLAIAFAAALATVIVLAAWRLRAVAGRLAAAAVVAGVVLAVSSALFRSSRGAGTGTSTAFGWPRAVYTRWVSWETPERVEGIRLQGIAENAIFYAAVSALAVSLGLAAWRERW